MTHCYFTLCPITEEFKNRVQGREKVEVKPGIHTVSYYRGDLISELMWFMELTGIELYRRKRYYNMAYWSWLAQKNGYLSRFVSVESGQATYPFNYRLDFLLGPRDKAEWVLDLISLVVNKGYRSVLVGLDLLPEHLRETREYLGDP